METYNVINGKKKVEAWEMGSVTSVRFLKLTLVCAVIVPLAGTSVLFIQHPVTLSFS